MTKAELEKLRELWRARVADFRASGLTGAAWCAAHQIKEHQLWYWVSKFKAESTPASPPRFIPVQVHESIEEPENPRQLSVRVGPAVIEVSPGFDADLLRDVVRTLTLLC